MPPPLGRALGLFSLVVCAACATIDFDAPREESVAYVDTQDTTLGRAIDELSHADPGESGFYVLPDGVDALATRLLLAAEAERSIDAQYYLIHDGVAARLFLQSLLEAADRGVRDRLLLDDFLTLGLDEGLLAFHSHPNVEVRLFNPFAHRRFRLFDLPSFRRVNRRMHNKSFTVDNQATVIGGRNIGDEYFGAREDVNFSDLDVFGVGSVVAEVSTMFDTYWNSDRALPLPAVVRPEESYDEEAAVAALRELLEGSLANAFATRYGEVLHSVILETLKEEANLTWCRYQLVYDSPDKTHAERAKDASSMIPLLASAIGSADEEVLIISPYFVPLRSARHGLRDLVASGVETVVVTNGLAANNHTAVHAGYAPTRVPLLRSGVEIWEVRANAPSLELERVGHESSRATLHAKAFVVDRDQLFIGSFNFDPRSVHLNTEMGILLESPELASATAEGLRAALPEAAYQVTVDEHHKLHWTTWQEGETSTFTHEPDTGFWKRFSAALMELLPIRGQL